MHLITSEKLYIATDLTDTNWLVYLLEEFQRIQQAQFTIQLITLSEAKTITDVPMFFYTSPFISNALWINSVPIFDLTQHNDLHYLTKDFFVFRHTLQADSTIGYDLFWNAFIHLSRLEEYLSEQSGQFIKSYCAWHPRIDKTTFTIPIVNKYFNVLEQFIQQYFPTLTFRIKEKPIIELSHDLDYIQKTIQLRLKQTVFNGFNSLRSLSQFNIPQFQHNLGKTLRFFFSNPSYWCFDYWEEIEKKFQQKSIFYVFAHVHTKNVRSWLIDPSYRIATNEDLQNRLKALYDEGFEIGLHGSFYSATNKDLLTQEKETLVKSLGLSITKTRQHWLCYEENCTPYLHEQLFEYDATLGWNDAIGFRAACCSQYHPYNHKAQKAFSHWETPQLIMDANIFDYANEQQNQLAQKGIQLLTELAQYRSAHVSISWHPRTCSSDYRWHFIYENYLNQLAVMSMQT